MGHIHRVALHLEQSWHSLSAWWQTLGPEREVQGSTAGKRGQVPRYAWATTSKLTPMSVIPTLGAFHQWKECQKGLSWAQG